MELNNGSKITNHSITELSCLLDFMDSGPCCTSVHPTCTRSLVENVENKESIEENTEPCHCFPQLCRLVSMVFQLNRTGYFCNETFIYRIPLCVVVDTLFLMTQSDH